MRFEVESFRAQRAKSPDGQVMVSWLGGIGGQTIVGYLGLMGGFPNTAWTDLTDGDKNMWKKMLMALPHVFSIFSISSNPPLTFKPNVPDGMTLAQWEKSLREKAPLMPKSEKIKFGFFAINLDFDKMELLQEFHKTLYSLEGKPISQTPPLETLIPKTKKPPGRRGFRDTLNALGALRLRSYYRTFSVAKKYMRHGAVFYEHRESFDRACRAAEQHFQNLFKWIDPNPPLHTTKRSRNRN